MSELVRAAIFFVAFFFLMFCLGSYVQLIVSKEKITFGISVVYGFILYFFLFELVAFPMMILQRSLTELSFVWGILLGVLVIAACVKFRHVWIEQWKERIFRNYTADFYLMMLLIGVQCIFVVLWTDNSPDAAYYVANVSANVATDTINIYEPFTGALQEEFYVRYLFGLYPVHNSVVCQLTGIHPLLLTKTVMSVFTVIMSYLVYAKIGEQLFEKDEKKVWRLLVFFAIAQFFFHTVYSGSTFLFTRGYEGKAILANVVIPFILYLGLCLFGRIDDKKSWFMLFCTGIAGVNISMSGMSILPVAISAVALLAIFVHRAWRYLKYYILCILPSVAVLAVYLLCSKGYLVFGIQ